MKKNKFIIFFVLIFFFLLIKTSSTVMAGAERPLEVQYPPLPFPGVEVPTSTSTAIPNYFRYIYYFFLFAGGLAGLGVLVYAGFRYMTSTGNPEKIKDAKEQILAALFGLIILFASALILNQISPDLTRIQLRAVAPIVPSFPPGVLICTEWINVDNGWELLKESQDLYKQLDNASSEKEDQIIKRLEEIKIQTEKILDDINKKCVIITSSGDIPEPLNDKGKYVFTIPSGFATSSNQYGVILYEKTKFEGESLIFYSWNDPPKPCAFEKPSNQGGKSIEDLKPSSAKPFVLNFNPQTRPVWDVLLYELIDFNKADDKKKVTKPDLPSENNPAEYTQLEQNQKIGSLKIEGKFIVIFFKEAATDDNRYNHWEKEIDVFVETDSNLEDNRMGKWCGIWPKRYACASAVIVISGSIY